MNSEKKIVAKRESLAPGLDPQKKHTDMARRRAEETQAGNSTWLQGQ